MTFDTLESLKKTLPANPGIHSADEHGRCAVMVLIASIKNELHFVFEKRSSTIRQAGELCFPGGIFDSEHDKTSEEAALRETREELGLDSNAISIIGRLNSLVTHRGMIAEVFLGFTKNTPEDLTINPAEVEKALFIPVSFFENQEPLEYHVVVKTHPSYTDPATGREIILLPGKELGLPPQYHQPWGDFKQKVFVYKTEHGPLWGLTARIVFDFVKRLKD